MPLYEYKCAACGDVFELLQKFSDPPLTTHDKCGGDVERLISTSALQFKGSGWYVTDYAKGSSADKPAKTENPKADTAKSGSSTPPKTESTSSTPSATPKT